MVDVLDFLKDLNLAFDFDTELNLKKKIEIKKASLYINGEEVKELTKETLNIQEAAKITQVCYDKLYANKAEHFTSLGTPQILRELDYIYKLIDLLKSIKRLHCSTVAYRGAYEKYAENLTWIYNRCAGTAYTVIGERSIAENLALRTFGADAEDKLADYTLLQLKNPDAIIKHVKELKKQIKAFDYSDYTIDMTKAIVTECKRCDMIVEGVEEVKKFLATVGNKIVNYGNIKIRNELNKAKIASGYLEQHLCQEYREDLIAKGLVPKEKFIAKNKSKQALTNGTATQEDLLRVFKTGTVNDAEQAITKMDWASIKEIMTSDLEVIKKRMSNSYYRHSMRTKIIYRAMEIATSDTAKEVFDYAVDKAQGTLFTSEFLDKCIPFINEQHLRSINFAPQRLIVSEKFYNEILKPIPVTNRYFNVVITHNYLLYGTDTEKLNYIKNLKQATDNQLSSHNIDEIYALVPYNKLRNILINRVDLLKQGIGDDFHSFILANKDKELAKLIVQHMENKFYTYNSQISNFINLLDGKDRIEGLIKYCNSYSYSDVEISSSQEAIDLLKCMLKQPHEVCTGVFNKILCKLLETNMFNDQINSLLAAYKGKVMLQRHTQLNRLPNYVKGMWLKKGNELDFDEQYRWYRGTVAQTFFETFTKEELKIIFGNNIPEQYKKHLGQLLSNEELIQQAETDKDFLEFNIHNLPYSYLVKYENEDYRKKKLGDMRDSHNQSIKNKIINQLDELRKSGATNK